ncbi:hypothetical protein [Caulobacter vibrioides]|uniref:hypothetical protein n=1 Tax=Caulobacter vibrioides TaxID=155892 RepID=UPI000BB463B2|nr:hypothetical protein [Caulobacter vibrioides]ATC23823.1 hypothetical protein CA608_04380 [Caulobacter vibrioides]PLR15967.1 hypothetical protein CVUC_02425 [Caulobacter vibrioides]
MTTLSARDFLKEQARIADDLANEVQKRLVHLPDRPGAADPVSQAAWDAQYQYLTSQRQRLSALATTFAVQAAGAAIDDVAQGLKDVAKATEAAQEQIKQIEKVSDFVTRIAQVIDLGVAVAAAIADPSVGTLKTVAEKVKVLASPVREDDEAGGG